MPTTRSHHRGGGGKVFEEPPRSPSTALMAGRRGAVPRHQDDGGRAAGGLQRTPPPSATEYLRDQAAMAADAVRGHGGAAGPAPATRSERSARASSSGSARITRRSAASTTARVAEAQRVAAEELETIKKEMAAKLRAAEARISEQIERARTGSDRSSVAGSVLDPQAEHERVDEWLRASATHLEEAAGEVPPRAPARGEPGPAAPAPTPRSDIAMLADALQACVLRQRQPSRQAMELPTFTGAPGEWLPFKAAMRESTARYEIGAAENIARLRVCLRDGARSAVEALLHTAVDPEVIMSTLERCYGHPVVIATQCMDELRRLPRVGATASELNQFALKVTNIIQILTTIGKRAYLFNPAVPSEIVERLSPYMRARWADYATEHCTDDDNTPEAVVLAGFLNREAERSLRYTYLPPTASKAAITMQQTQAARPALSAARGPLGAARGPPAAATTAAAARARGARQSVFATTTSGASPQQDNANCALCDGEHTLLACPKYKSLGETARWKTVRSLGLCFRCVTKTHRRTDCNAEPCGVRGCQRPHHKSLHFEKTAPREAAPPAETEETVLSCAAASEPRTVLLKVCPITVSGPCGSEDTYALLDEGSTVSLVDEELAFAIGAEGPARPLIIHGIGAGQDEPGSRCVDISLRGRGDDTEHHLRARTVRDLRLRGQSAPPQLLAYGHLSDLEDRLAVYRDAQPRVLIGADQWHLIVTRELRVGRPTEPAASRTHLGWVAHGTAPRALLQDAETVLHLHEPRGCGQASGGRSASDRLLHDAVEHHFRIDALGVVPRGRLLSAEDERAVETFNRTCRRVEGGYEVGLPWREDAGRLPESYAQAHRRLRTLEKKMDASPDFARVYTEQVQNLITKQYAVLCNGTEAESPRAWYLPHFAVYNINKPGKTRLVFDARAESHGVSLNSALLEGPNKLQSLQGVLFRFRERPVAVTSDVAEMFLRVRIREEDQPAQLFLWRGSDRARPPTEYKMRAMIFGAKCSPFLAHSVRDANAEAHAATHPRALAAITQQHYMDDYVDSHDTVEEARHTIKEVRAVHSVAGFTLRGWQASDAAALTDVPAELQATTRRGLCEGAGPDQKILGLRWDAENDYLAFNVDMKRVPEAVRARRRAPTKREALSAVMSIYDPLGLLSHYTIAAKIVLQRLWSHRMGWDEPIPNEEAGHFDEWMAQLANVAQLKIPRVYGPAGFTCVELHVMCDASSQAFAAVAYFRFTDNEEAPATSVALVAAKSKVAPRRTQTIPRLELQAAVIGARLADTVRREHRLNLDRVVYWTDSSTVQNWIQHPGRRYTPFVAHRLTEIAELTEGDQWRWLPSGDNVADDATRLRDEPVTADARWYRGPAFLGEPESLWPAALLAAEAGPTDEEVVLACAALEGAGGAHLPEVARFSTYERLRGAAARVFAFADICRGRAARLELAHIQRAELALLRRAQEEDFALELDRLRRGRPVPRASRLYPLDPVVTEDGLLRARGRLSAARLPDDTKRPVILNGRHPLTRLIVARAHRAALHANNERVVNDLRQAYCVLRLRPTVRAVARACALCRVRRARPTVPTTGDLPAERLQPFQRPFTHCGVDYFGPLTVRVGRRHEKRWVALFTCLTTRGVHLEVVHSLSTDSALLALRRMAARRGWPATIFSDNATCFRGADSELRAAYAEWAAALEGAALTHGAQWRFIPPGAPNMGGAWERLVRSVKTALTASLHEQSPREEVLLTVLAEAEHCINSRPLTHVPVSHDDPEALTPNHFLLGTSTGLPTTGQCDAADRRAWRAAQALADTFWRRWVREYLPTLLARGESHVKKENLKIGDLVVVADGTLPRNTWPRGEVVRTNAGHDGVVRSADVRTRGGVFRRPARKLAVLLRAADRVEDATR